MSICVSVVVSLSVVVSYSVEVVVSTKVVVSITVVVALSVVVGWVTLKQTQISQCMPIMPFFQSYDTCASPIFVVVVLNLLVTLGG